MPIKVVDLIDERNGRVLPIAKGDWWILPGGKVEVGEGELKCLRREVHEELGCGIAKIQGKMQRIFRGISPIRNQEIEVTVLKGDIDCKHMGDVKPFGAGWFSRKSISKLKLSDVTRQILQYYFSVNKGE